MCACRPNVRTPNCGSMACLAAARRNAVTQALSFIRLEAERMRKRNEGADEAVAAHFDIVADQIDRGEHLPRRGT